jgi:hypothetical protein
MRFAEFANVPTQNMSEVAVIAKLASVASEIYGLEPETYVNALSYGNTYDMNTRTAWKYACTRGVYSTPQFFVNGVAFVGNLSWTANDWLTVFKQIA